MERKEESFSFFDEDLFSNNLQLNQSEIGLYSPEYNKESFDQGVVDSNQVCRKLFLHGEDKSDIEVSSYYYVADNKSDIFDDRFRVPEPTDQSYQFQYCETRENQKQHIGIDKSRNIRNRVSDDGFVIPEPPSPNSNWWLQSPSTQSNDVVFNSQQTLINLPTTKATPLLRAPADRAHSSLPVDIKAEVLSPSPTEISSLSAYPPVFHSPVKKDGCNIDENFLWEALLDWACHVDLSNTLEQQSFAKDEIEEALSVHMFDLQIDVALLMDYNQPLGCVSIDNPILFTSWLTKCCFELLKNDGMIKNLRSFNQIIINPEFKNVPVTFENTVKSHQDVLRMRQKQGVLMRLRVVVIGMSSSITYTQSARYVCQEKSCVSLPGNCFLISKLFGMQESDVIKSNCRCTRCGSVLQEDIRKRTFGKKRYIFVIPKDAISNLGQISNSNNHRSQAIKMVIKDELMGSVAVGKCLWFTGIYKHDLQLSNTLQQNQHVNGIFESVGVVEDFPFIHRLKHFQYLLPDSLCSLYHDRISSPWSFVASLAYCFLESVVPPGLYNLLKLSLLLSLVMTGDTSSLNLDEKNRVQKINQLNILVEDYEMLIYQRLMLNASCYADTAVIHRESMQLFGSVSDDGDIRYVDGGSLSIASRGICVIPNLLTLNKAKVEKLQKSFEDEIVTVDVPSKQREEVQQSQFFLPFQSSVWCCSEINRVLRTNDVRHKEITNVSTALSSHFNLVVNLSRNSTMDFDEIVSSFLLDKSMNVNSTVEFVKDADIKEFIKRVRSHQVEMSTKAFKLLKTFYLVSRRVNSDVVTHKTFRTLLVIAAAHAKLMLHKTVSLNDAVFAINLHEQTMALRYGDSVVGVSPILHFRSNDMSHFVGPENDARMYQLRHHIIDYCSTYYPNVLNDIL